MSNRNIHFVHIKCYLTTQNLIFLFFQVQVKYDLNNDGQDIEEKVGLHYEDNYIKIEATPVGSKTPATMVHDFNAVNSAFLKFFIFICNQCILFDMTTKHICKSNYFLAYDTDKTGWSLFCTVW